MADLADSLAGNRGLDGGYDGVLRGARQSLDLTLAVLGHCRRVSARHGPGARVYPGCLRPDERIVGVRILGHRRPVPVAVASEAGRAVADEPLGGQPTDVTRPAEGRSEALAGMVAGRPGALPRRRFCRCSRAARDPALAAN